VVTKIINTLLSADLAGHIAPLLSEARKTVTLPTDMKLENFQTMIGSRVEGIIGIQHMKEFPQPVFHMSNGLVVFKHKLRAQAGRDNVYCIGGNATVLKGVADIIGPQCELDSVLIAMTNDEVHSRSIIFDGDHTDRHIRSLPLLSDPTEREAWGEHTARQITYASRTNMALDKTMRHKMVDFHVLASPNLNP
jgi:hypothetical protein